MKAIFIGNPLGLLQKPCARWARLVFRFFYLVKPK